LKERDYLNGWLISLYSSLKDKNKQIKEMEDRVLKDKRLHEVQLKRVNKWLSDENLDQIIREELEYSQEFLEKLPKDNERKLELLKNGKKATLYMIEKVQKELRD